MMPIVNLPLRTKRDLLLARQRARQIARLLHFETHDQACIAAGTFAIALQALQVDEPSCLSIQIAHGKLEVFARTQTEKVGLRLSKPLPPSVREVAAEDLTWILHQLTQQAPRNVFEEIHHQNQEMLALLHALRQAQSQLALLKGSPSSPSAA